MMGSSRHRVTAALVALAIGALLGNACGSSPALWIDTPAHGEFVDAPSVVVTGRATNVNPQQVTLLVNGVLVPVQPNGSWSTPVALDPNAVFNPVLADMTITGVSGRFRKRIVVIAGPSVADGELSPSSVALRVNDRGLDALEPMIEGMVDIDLAALLPIGTYLTSVSLLWNFNIYVDSPAPRYSGFSLDMDSQVDAVDGFIDLTNVRVDLLLDGTGFLAPDCGARVTTSLLEIDGSYALDPLAADPALVDVTQVGGVSFGNTSFGVDITWGFWCEVADFFGLIGNVNDRLESGLAGFLDATDAAGNTPVAGALEEALSGIQITGPIGDGLGVSLEAPIVEVREDARGITLESDSSFQAAVGTGAGQCDAPAAAPDLSASLASTDPFPDFAHCEGGTSHGSPCASNAVCPGGACLARTPEAGLPYGLAISSSRAAFNQLLKSQTECGLLVQSGATAIRELDLAGNPQPLTAGLLAVFVPQFSIYPPATLLRMEIVPTLAPVITPNPGPNGELGELRIAHLDLRIVQDDGTEFLPLAGSFDATIPLDITFDDETGSLVFELGAATADDIDIVITVNRVNADELSLEQFVLPGVIAFFLPSLAAELAQFPLPEFFGLSLQGVEVSRQGDFLSIFTDLSAAP